MKTGSFVTVLLAAVLMVLSGAVALGAEPVPGDSAPPIAQQLVREGELALKLVPALGLEAAEDESEAETRLAAAGISPRNGWIADYPVTPDVLGELQSSVAAAAEAGKIPVGKEQALAALEGVAGQSGLNFLPPSETREYQPPPGSAATYPDPSVINNYYLTEGPPVVTYYTPPPDYYYLYSWIPYPFWWTGFWFPGFFVLNDFHRPHFAHGRGVVFVSNHFNDVRSHRVYRVDPGARFRGRTYAGIGATNRIGAVNRRGFISTGVPSSERRIFNRSYTRSAPARVPGRTYSAPSGRGSGTVTAPRTRGYSRPGPGGGSVGRSIGSGAAGPRATGGVRGGGSAPGGSLRGGSSRGGGGGRPR